MLKGLYRTKNSNHRIFFLRFTEIRNHICYYIVISRLEISLELSCFASRSFNSGFVSFKSRCLAYASIAVNDALPAEINSLYKTAANGVHSFDEPVTSSTEPARNSPVVPPSPAINGSQIGARTGTLRRGVE